MTKKYIVGIVCVLFLTSCSYFKVKENESSVPALVVPTGKLVVLEIIHQIDERYERKSAWSLWLSKSIYNLRASVKYLYYVDLDKSEVVVKKLDGENSYSVKIAAKLKMDNPVPLNEPSIEDVKNSMFIHDAEEKNIILKSYLSRTKSEGRKYLDAEENVNKAKVSLKESVLKFYEGMNANINVDVNLEVK